MPPTPSTQADSPSLSGQKRDLWIAGIGVAVAAGVYIAVMHSILRSGAGEGVRFRLDPNPLLEAGIAVQVHVAAAVVSFALGAVILSLPKGRGLHKPLGRIWVATMLATAVSSFFIRQIIPGSFSPIHALSAWTLIALPMGLATIRSRNVAAHRKFMGGTFLGGMVIAGLFTFLPGRIMWATLLGA